jgi:ABC-type sugar transport system permease subunit
MVDENDNIVEGEETLERYAVAQPVLTLPFIITLVALTIYFAFQTLQLSIERNNLGLVKANQDAAMQEAQKVQAQFKTLVTKTGELAAQGHAGAKMVMEELQKRGLGAAPEAIMPETKAPPKSQTKPAN